MYVSRIIPQERTLIVGPVSEIMRKKFTVTELHWIREPEFPLTCTVRIRHRHNDSPARVYPNFSGELIVEFDQPQRAITPGQSAVFYDGLLVIGGGIIDKLL